MVGRELPKYELNVSFPLESDEVDISIYLLLFFVEYINNQFGRNEYLFILFIHQHMQLKFQIYTNVVNKKGRQCW